MLQILQECSPKTMLSGNIMVQITFQNNEVARSCKMDVYYGDLSISLDILWYGKNWFVFGKTPQLRHTIYGICHTFDEVKFYDTVRQIIPLHKEDIESSASHITHYTLHITHYTLQKIFGVKLNQITQKPPKYLY
ncbi:hypothetical protein ACQKN7_27445 [Bacillus cereus]|uniref:hypothetical protein n=1 Tax=Bacillus cereus TaxID=1396 RepID=UPI003D056DFE